MNMLFFMDIIDDLYWWGGILYRIMLLLPPLEWTSERDIYNKYFIYIGIPLIALFLFHMFIFMLRRRGRKDHQTIKVVRAGPTSFTCPHCGYVPFPQPNQGTYHCNKCGKSSRV